MYEVVVPAGMRLDVTTFKATEWEREEEVRACVVSSLSVWEVFSKVVVPIEAYQYKNTNNLHLNKWAWLKLVLLKKASTEEPTLCT